jgi:hypothetical protein
MVRGSETKALAPVAKEVGENLGANGSPDPMEPKGVKPWN